MEGSDIGLKALAARGRPRRRGAAVCLFGAAWATALAASAREPDASWRDALPRPIPKQWTPIDGGQWRQADRLVQVHAEPGSPWAALALGPATLAGHQLEVEVRWEPRDGQKGGGVELAVGPHAAGSWGYRLVASRQPWRVAECRQPKLAPREWHTIRLRATRSWLEYWLQGTLVARCRVACDGSARLLVARGTQAAVRGCRYRPWRPAGAADACFVYRAEQSRHDGTVVADRLARGGSALQVFGQGPRRPLLWGQDAWLPADGQYVANFGVRCVGGTGTIWLAVGPSGHRPAASRAMQAQEVPTDRFARVAVPFQHRGQRPMEYRVAAQAGVCLLVDEVAVTQRGTSQGGAAADSAHGLGQAARVRRPRPLDEVWPARPKQRAHGGLAVVRLVRRLLADGSYAVGVVWRQDQAQPVDDVAVDLWVGCRDQDGRIKTFDFGAAYDQVAAGLYQTAAQLDAASCRRYGRPAALFVQLSRGGTPLASAWRKWGIPVEDRYILPAKRLRRLREFRGAIE